MNDIKYVYTVEIVGNISASRAKYILEDAFKRQKELENQYQAPVSVEFVNMNNKERFPDPVITST